MARKMAEDPTDVSVRAKRLLTSPAIVIDSPEAKKSPVSKADRPRREALIQRVLRKTASSSP